MKFLLPLCCFPPIPIFALLLKKTDVIFDIYETYPKQTFRNRFVIINSNGYKTISIAIHKPFGNATKTKDVLISTHNNFAAIIRSIDTAYNTSPYYEFFRDQFVQLLNYASNNNLIDFNINSIYYVLNTLKLKKELKLTNSFIHPKNTKQYNILDLRYTINPKNPFFCTFASPNYYHTYHTEMTVSPSLCILDLLFHCGLETIDYLYNYPVNEFINHIHIC